MTSIGLFKDKLPETLKHFFFLVPFLEIDELAWIKNFQNRNQPDEKNEVWRMSSDGSYLVKLKVVNGQPWVTDNTELLPAETAECAGWLCRKGCLWFSLQKQVPVPVGLNSADFCRDLRFCPQGGCWDGARSSES